jgi:hypothetical protein
LERILDQSRRDSEATEGPAPLGPPIHGPDDPAVAIDHRPPGVTGPDDPPQRLDLARDRTLSVSVVTEDGDGPADRHRRGAESPVERKPEDRALGSDLGLRSAERGEVKPINGNDGDVVSPIEDNDVPVEPRANPASFDERAAVSSDDVGIGHDEA